MKAFIDTNVIVAAVAANGLCNALMEELLVRGRGEPPYQDWDVRVSERVLSETASLLAERLQLSAPKVRDRIARLTMHARMCPPVLKPLSELDEVDGLLLGDAAGAGCQFFITGDRGLLQIYSIDGMRIITPREAMDLICRGMEIPRHEVQEERAAYMVRRLESVV